LDHLERENSTSLRPATGRDPEPIWPRRRSAGLDEDTPCAVVCRQKHSAPYSEGTIKPVRDLNLPWVRA